jgi:arsenate reductase (thioredoxin)
VKVIFACVHNAGRSQMAAAFFNELAETSRDSAISAGTEPGERVHSEVVQVMKEIGVDLSSAKPQLLTDELARQSDMLITMGCGDACLYVPGLKKDDWPLEDPKGKPLQTVRNIRDQIKLRIQELIQKMSADLKS